MKDRQGDVELSAQRVVTVGTQLCEQTLNALQHLLEDLVVDRVGNPPRRLLLDTGANDLAILVHDTRRDLNHFVEHFLMTVVFRHHLQHFSQQRREVHRAHAVGADCDQ